MEQTIFHFLERFIIILGDIKIILVDIKMKVGQPKVELGQTAQKCRLAWLYTDGNGSSRIKD